MRSFAGLLGWVLVVSLAAAIGGFASANARDFYTQLVQPSWAPPSWLFGPVWSLLYFLMALSAWLVWRKHGWRGASTALTVFLMQLILNALWSWLFFTWQLGAVAFAQILILLSLIALTIVKFKPLHRAAAWLLSPYFAWVAFATALNFSLWRLNPALLG